MIATVAYGVGTGLLIFLFTGFDALRAAIVFVGVYGLTGVFAAFGGVEGFSVKEAIVFYAAILLIGVLILAMLLAVALLQGRLAIVLQG